MSRGYVNYLSNLDQLPDSQLYKKAFNPSGFKQRVAYRIASGKDFRNQIRRGEYDGTSSTEKVEGETYRYSQQAGVAERYQYFQFRGPGAIREN
jgi:hypothetical protein